ncbi:uncharacterized protein LOC113371452 [Ctenocephalides felis]|uniref:uncharacterized protein LOC113371452 n=1 Tax=Ctenocephalides felis TaxID=7515 RepID=UPI000E6E1318|nr:uncharacterized protein LOC113371452 [Ctenocephalides felis]
MNHCEAAHDLLMQTVRDMKIDVALLSEPYKHLTDWPWKRTVPPKPCYAPPSLSLPDFVDFLDRLVEDAKRHHPVAIAGDFNAWAVDWGSRKTNARGKALLEAFNTLDVVLLNSGDKPTFEKGSASSIIDLTFDSNSLVRGICNWEVLDIYTASDHNAIIWEISTNRNISRNAKISKAIGQSAHWWTEEISSLRKECLKKRRISQRGYSLSNSAQLVVEYKQARRQLNKAIKDSKVRCWKELLDEVEENPWGRPYKTVMSRLKSQPIPSPTCPRLLNKIVTTLFPRQPNLNYQVTHVEQNNIPLITLQELMEACHRVGVFRRKWKQQRLVLIPKGKKPPDKPSSYRPICMLDTAGYYIVIFTVGLTPSTVLLEKGLNSRHLQTK